MGFILHGLLIRIRYLWFVHDKNDYSHLSSLLLLWKLMRCMCIEMMLLLVVDGDIATSI